MVKLTGPRSRLTQTSKTTEATPDYNDNEPSRFFYIRKIAYGMSVRMEWSRSPVLDVECEILPRVASRRILGLHSSQALYQTSVALLASFYGGKVQRLVLRVTISTVYSQC